MVASSVISRPIGTIVELSTIVKICKSRGLHEGHHFIPMAMEVHDTPKLDMNCFIRECAYLFHDKQSCSHLSLYFYIQFFKQHVNITPLRALTSIIERKIVFAGDTCFSPPIIIRSHNLRAGDIKRVVGGIVSYHKKN
jgi:hypothetical protein